VKDESGQLLHDQIEVLSGLRQGEQVVLPAGSKPEAAAPNCPVAIPAATPSRETGHD
jgi:hypothetical protein